MIDSLSRIRGLFFLFVLTMLSHCSESSMNTVQYLDSINNLDCYNSIIELIRNDSNFLNSLVAIRDSKVRGEMDPIFVKGTYRQIDYAEISHLLENTIDSTCVNLFISKDDLNGIRYIGSDLIIIEVDKFSRHTLNEKFSSRGTTEFHRIIYSSAKPDLKLYAFGGEGEILYEKIRDDCYYQVTQVEKRHGKLY